VRITGTRLGELMGIPATGKPIDVGALAMHRAENGKCTESWFILEEMKMMGQPGVAPG